MKCSILCAVVLYTGYLFGANAQLTNRDMSSFVQVFPGAENILPLYTIRGGEKERVGLQNKKQQIVLAAYQNEEVRNAIFAGIEPQKTVRAKQVYDVFKSKLPAADVSNLKNLQFFTAVFKFKQRKKPVWRLEMHNGTNSVAVPAYEQGELKKWFATTQFLSIDPKTLETTNFLDEERAQELYRRSGAEAVDALLQIWEEHLQAKKCVGFIVDIPELQRHYNKDESCALL